MTVSSTIRKAGPFDGNDVATDFDFEFKVFSKEDIQVVRTLLSSGVDTILVLDSDYSVTLNADQDNDPGGVVTYPLAGSPLSPLYKLTILSVIEATQSTELLNLGGWKPRVVENMIDRVTALIQQFQELLSRTLRFSTTYMGSAPEIPADGVQEGFLKVEGGALYITPGTGSDTLLRTDLANDTDAAKGAALVGFKDSAAGHDGTTVHRRFKKQVYFDEYGLFTDAEAAVKPEGGMVIFTTPDGTIDLTTRLVPTKRGIILQGDSRLATRLRYTGAVLAGDNSFVELLNVSWNRISDMTFDGNGLVDVTYGYVVTPNTPPPPFYGSGNNLVTNVNFVGGKVDNVKLGGNVNQPDVAANTFVHCGFVGGFTDSNARVPYSGTVPTGANIRVLGSNTSMVNVIGGIIGNARTPINIIVEGGALSLQGVQGINAEAWHVKLLGGQFSDSQKSHIEGRGGYLWWASDTQPRQSAHVTLDTIEAVNTGEFTGGVVIKNDTARQISMRDVFLNADVEITNAAGKIKTDDVEFGQVDTTHPQAVAINSGSWAAGVATLITATAHGVVPGAFVMIGGATTGYNLTTPAVALAGTVGTTVKYPLAIDPGVVAGAQGTVRRQAKVIRSAGTVPGDRKGVTISYVEGVNVEPLNAAVWGDTRKVLWRFEGVLAVSPGIAGPTGPWIEFVIQEGLNNNSATIRWKLGAASPELVSNHFGGAVFEVGVAGSLPSAAGKIMVTTDVSGLETRILAGATYAGQPVHGMVRAL